jgi:ATP-dependent RNA helicase RhlE
MQFPNAEVRFADLNLSSSTLAILDRLGFVTPTPIQAQAIPHGVKGRDVIGLAQTGTGKTLAFGLPVLERFKREGNLTLVIVPTRELAIQVEEVLLKIGLHTVLIIGGAPMGRQVSQLRGRPTVIVGTPGRIKDHLMQRTMHLDRASMVVLDEADRMLDMGFAPDIKFILERTPRDRQTLLFSATMPPEIADLARNVQKDPVRVEIEREHLTADLVEQELVVVEKEARGDMLRDFLSETSGPVLVFVRTRHGARKVARTVNGMGHIASELHSDRTLAQRKSAMEAFRSGRSRILVATDIAARGIDVKNIEMVINYDLPDQHEDYVHRIGRTGRAGMTGKSVTFATPEQHKDVLALEKLIRSEIPRSLRSTAAFPAIRPHQPHTGGGRPSARGGRPFRQGAPARFR